MTAQKFSKLLKQLVELLDQDPQTPSSQENALDRLVQVTEIFLQIKAAKEQILALQLRPRWKSQQIAENMRKHIFEMIDRFLDDKQYFILTIQPNADVKDRLYIHIPGKKNYRQLSKILQSKITQGELDEIKGIFARKFSAMAFSFGFDFFGKEES